MLAIRVLMEFSQCTANSRNFTEGERVLNASHLILCGQLADSASDDVIRIYALVLSSSKISENPLTITGDVKEDLSGILKMQYSCKAGMSECCKHVVAVLLHMNRNRVNELELLPGTDVKCVWSAGKAGALADYKPIPLKKWSCCIKMRDFPNEQNSDDKATRKKRSLAGRRRSVNNIEEEAYKLNKQTIETPKITFNNNGTLM